MSLKEHLLFVTPGRALLSLYFLSAACSLCFSALRGPYLDCSRWEGLWPALNLTKIKPPASVIIFFKVFSSYLLLTLRTTSPHPDHLLWLAKVLFLLSYFLTDVYWDILTCLWILWYCCKFFSESILIKHTLLLEPFYYYLRLVHSLFSFNPCKSPS